MLLVKVNEVYGRSQNIDAVASILQEAEDSLKSAEVLTGDEAGFVKISQKDYDRLRSLGLAGQMLEEYAEMIRNIDVDDAKLPRSWSHGG